MPLTPLARRTLLPQVYSEYSKTMGDMLSYEGKDIDNQRAQFTLDQGRKEADQDAAARADMQSASAKIAALDPNDPDYAKRRLEIISRHPNALYSRAANEFLGASSAAAAEPTHNRQRNMDWSAQDKRDADNEAKRQRQADDRFARELALKAGRRDFYDKWRSGYDSAKTDDERRKVTDDLGWEHQQWGVKLSLVEAGLDPEKYHEDVPGQPGKKYLGEKALAAMAMARNRLSTPQREAAITRLTLEIADARAKGEDTTSLEQRKKELESGIMGGGGGAATGLIPAKAAPQAQSKGGSKFP